MGIAAGRLDVQGHARSLSQALERVPGKPGILGERDLGAASPAEVDGGTGQRIVHRHDSRSVACDSAAVAEGLVERLAKRDRSVLRCVMVTGLPVAASVDDEVEPAVEGELLEQVVVEAGASGDAHAAGAVETWVRGVEFACDDSRVAVGGRVLDLRTPAARYPEVFLSLHGAHQADNAACAVAAAEAFFGAPLSAEVVEHGLGSVRVPGRMEIVGRSPVIVLDGAHNVAGAQALARALVAEFAPADDTIALIGMLQGRDPSAMLDALRPAGVRTVVACTAPSPRALPATSIAEAARALGLQALASDTVRDGLTLARARLSSTGTLIVTGSLYVVADAREILFGSTALPDPDSLTEP